jgi:hypothetical protein
MWDATRNPWWGSLAASLGCPHPPRRGGVYPYLTRAPRQGSKSQLGNSPPRLGKVGARPIGPGPP